MTIAVIDRRPTYPTGQLPARRPVGRRPAPPRSVRGRPVLPRLLAGLDQQHRRPGQQTALDQHERCYGPLPLPTEAGLVSWRDAGRRSGDRDRARAYRLIELVERSGLTGRGGAGFPVGRKLRSVTDGAGPTVVVANGAEGEPASRKDRLLLTRLPHLVLDGISLAAYATGATEAYLAVHGDDPRLIAALQGAVQARAVAGIDPVPIQVVGIAARYVASEQSAIVQHINGGPGLPTFSPPRTHERGVAGRPTALNNVETLSHLALIARYGDGWFREAGYPSDPGTTLVTVSGAVGRPGVYEVEQGISIGDIVMHAGGPAERPQAILTGGYFGSWLPAEVAWRIPMSRAGLRSAGGAMGAGIVVVLPQSSCGLAETARVVRYLARESAGQCGPCMFGLPALADLITDLAFRGGRGDAADRLGKLIPLIEGRGACRHPDGATQLAASAVRAFWPHVRWHDNRGPCAEVARPPVLPVPGEMEYW